jgi:large subunit ribosomal protein L7Ae
MKIPNLKFMV